jgi:two-component system chemotaxis response regulator CheY
MANPLYHFKVLIADSDQRLSQVLRGMLKQMGFANIQLVHDGKNALELLKKQPFDFLITDWNLKEMDGIAVATYIRRDANSPNMTMPIIMLTGRAETIDVKAARDMGINEFVVKPFSAKAIYLRLERIVEKPRYFIVAESFVGPDRRNKGAPEGQPEKRKTKTVPKRRKLGADGKKELENDSAPKVWLPDFTMKHKLGKNVSLDSIITPAVLSQAQAGIDAISDESLQWIREDLAELISLHKLLREHGLKKKLVEELNEVALIISSRAGTFGYMGGAEVAYMLYLFFRNKLTTLTAGHHTVIEKYVEVLQLIFGNGIKGKTEYIDEIVRELKSLTNKYAP